MTSHRAMATTEAPDWLPEILEQANIVLFCSNLTDVRALEADLGRRGVAWRTLTMGMGSAGMRERFRALSEYTGWRSMPQVFVAGEFVGGEPELRSHPVFTGAADRIPPVALLLGIAGLIPFVGGVLALWVGGSALAVHALPLMITYGVAILAFMGGAQWGGFTAVGGRLAAIRLTFSVAPALLAWEALLVPALPALVLLIIGFLLVYGLDEWWCRRGWFPDWYARLRRGLTAVVVLSLLACIVSMI